MTARVLVFQEFTVPQILMSVEELWDRRGVKMEVGR